MIEYPYLVLSDIHCHDWDFNDATTADGVSLRLQNITDAIDKAVRHLQAVGGKDIIITGDLFHTRGKVKPSVFNPVYKLFDVFSMAGFRVHAIPGNHDLENKHSDTIGNALTPFDTLKNFSVHNVPTQDFSFLTSDRFLFIPWIEDKDEFIKVLDEQTALLSDVSKTTLFCHIGLDGVLDNVKGKISKSVLEKGFKYVFAGDYHNHRYLGSGIYSVGALTHNSWADLGSLAGYLIVDELGVQHFETDAPKFIDSNGHDTPLGNYVRIVGEETQEDVDKYIEAFKKHGALAVLDLTSRPSLEQKDYSTTVKLDLGLKPAVESYVKHKYGGNAQEVLDECLKLMS